MLYHGQGVYSLIMPHLPMEMITGPAFKRRLICQEKWSLYRLMSLSMITPHFIRTEYYKLMR